MDKYDEALNEQPEVIDDIDDYEDDYEVEFEDEEPPAWYERKLTKVVAAMLVATGVMAIGIHVGRNGEEIAPSYFCPDAAQEVAAALGQQAMQLGANGVQLRYLGDIQTNPCYKYWINKWGLQLEEREHHDENTQKYFNEHQPVIPKALDPRASANPFGATGSGIVDSVGTTTTNTDTSSSLTISSGSILQ